MSPDLDKAGEEDDAGDGESGKSGEEKNPTASLYIIVAIIALVRGCSLIMIRNFQTPPPRNPSMSYSLCPADKP